MEMPHLAAIIEVARLLSALYVTVLTAKMGLG